MDSREEFEAAYDAWAGVTPGYAFLHRMGDSYELPKQSRAWHFWQASRAAVVIQAPDVCDCCYGEEARAMHECFMENIEAAGVKVAQ